MHASLHAHMLTLTVTWTHALFLSLSLWQCDTSYSASALCRTAIQWPTRKMHIYVMNIYKFLKWWLSLCAGDEDVRVCSRVGIATQAVEQGACPWRGKAGSPWLSPLQQVWQGTSGSGSHRGMAEWLKHWSLVKKLGVWILVREE